MILNSNSIAAHSFNSISGHEPGSPDLHPKHFGVISSIAVKTTNEIPGLARKLIRNNLK